MSQTVTDPKAEILRLHRAWFDANHGLQGRKLKDIMANEEFFNYNLNGYTYRGLSEIEKLWAPQQHALGFRSEKDIQRAKPSR